MYHSCLIHSSADGHLGCFHVLAIINSVQADSLLSEPPGNPRKDMVHSQTNKKIEQCYKKEAPFKPAPSSHCPFSFPAQSSLQMHCPHTPSLHPIFDGLSHAQSSFQGRACFPNYWECCWQIAFCYWPFRLLPAGERADSPKSKSILVCPYSMND